MGQRWHLTDGYCPGKTARRRTVVCTGEMGTGPNRPSSATRTVGYWKNQERRGDVPVTAPTNDFPAA
jgi:hypothetical protein